MYDVLLLRTFYSPHATVSSLVVNTQGRVRQVYQCNAQELSIKPDKTGCIPVTSPENSYLCQWLDSPDGSKHYMVIVPGKSNLFIVDLFNKTVDKESIRLGIKSGNVNLEKDSDPYLIKSEITLAEFENIMQQEDFYLSVQDFKAI